MNNTKVISVTLFILLAVGIYVWSSSGADAPTESVAIEESGAVSVDEVATTSNGSYETYSPEKLALAEAGKVVLFFRASWCPTCRALDADIRSNLDKIPEDVVILDVDYDNSTALKQKYGVTYQHTLVEVDASGNQISKWQGSLTLADVLAQIK